MDAHLKSLLVDAGTGFYKIKKYKVGDYFGPVDLGLHHAVKRNSLNFGVGLLAGSIFPGSNRLFVTGFSPCWGGFYISAMGGAGLVFDNLGLNMLSIIGKASNPSILYLNRNHGEELDIEVIPIELFEIWKSGEGGFYALHEYIYEKYKDRYPNDPRILATGPSAWTTDMGAIGSIPIEKGKITHADTWAGRGGFGSKMLQDHHIAGIIYGGSFIDEDFRDRKVADEWFQEKYQQKLLIKDFEATAKYRYEDKFKTGGTLGVNYASVGKRLIAFNYKSCLMSDQQRTEIHQKLIVNHYLKQFNEETIANKQYRTCGEPCSAVCKKLNGVYKKDYEPYQTLGPLCGIFDQRCAERVNRKADTYGFDAISVGGVLAWLMECLDRELLNPEDLGVTLKPYFQPENFDVVHHSEQNAELAVQLLDAIVAKKGLIDLSEGARKWGQSIFRQKNVNILDYFVYNAFGRKGWIVPNQYWNSGVLSPMAIMGKYFMYYGYDFLPPRELGRVNALRFKQELQIDNLGFCRFHRMWLEEMIPEIVHNLYDKKEAYIYKCALTASRINSRNASLFWESERNIDFVHTFLKGVDLEKSGYQEDLKKWLADFEADKKEAALNFWYEIHKGIQESLREF
ncbi:MAG: aldehyde ferredoxin oxidoreductase [Candidatus Cloacimonetes bacterium]|nr:aldehyde ferredoxin oxidoreductase [Candidatus Cloacimonadota bacterium]